MLIRRSDFQSGPLSIDSGRETRLAERARNRVIKKKAPEWIEVVPIGPHQARQRAWWWADARFQRRIAPLSFSAAAAFPWCSGGVDAAGGIDHLPGMAEQAGVPRDAKRAASPSHPGRK